ncbi:hypothetical protein ACFLTS_04025 [Chloroflexota bacterium]
MMSYNWGPHFIVPSEISRTFSGVVQLRERVDEDLLVKELAGLGFSDVILKVTNPWYYRKKGTDTWIKIGESDDQHRNFPVTWDTSGLGNGQYEVLGLMHVFVKGNGAEQAIARQSIVEVTVEN